MTANVSLNTALEFARDKQYDEAIKTFTSLLLQDQTYADAFYYRGCAYLHLGQYEKAINDYSSAISINLSSKHELTALYKRGYAYYKTNQFDSALDDYRVFINQCKSHPEQEHLRHKGLFQIGIIHAALNQHNSAVLFFGDAIENSKDSEEDKQKLYYLHRGRAYACDAKYDQAEKDLQVVLADSNDSFIKGCAYNELGQHRNALIEFEKLLQPNGNDSKLVQTHHDHILFRRGLSCASLNLHDHALSYFQSALTHSEETSSSNITDRILFRKGMSNMALDRTHKALIDFNESTKLNDNQSDVFYARGMLHYTLGRHDAAVYDQRKAMELERISPASAPVHNTIYHTHKHGDNYNNYIYYENKIREAEELLEKHKNTPYEPVLHRQIADNLHKQAPYSKDPSAKLEDARKHIKSAHAPTKESATENSVALAANRFYKAHCLDEKYSNREMPESAIEEYINCAAESILCMSDLFDQCVIKRDWRDLVAALRNELNKANKQRVSNSHRIYIMYISNQLEKSDIIQKTMDLFADSPAQQEFYGLLINRFTNLFDGVRMGSTGIFSHSLEGTCTKISWIFKLLGKLFAFVPIGSEYGKQLFGLCETGFKKLDETRIQNALDHLGHRLNPLAAIKTADAIVTELTKMYENQIKRFLTTSEEEAAAAAIANNNQQQQQQATACSKCASCFRKCCRCLGRQKNRLLNDIDLSTIETIVEYGASLSLSCLIRLEVTKIRKPERIQNVFVTGICRPSKGTFFHIMALADKIKPKDAKNDKDDWDTYDFFRRPAIDFENGTIRAQKETDRAKFGCRKPTFEEKYLLNTKAEKLDEFGFKIIIVE